MAVVASRTEVQMFTWPDFSRMTAVELQQWNIALLAAAVSVLAAVAGILSALVSTLISAWLTRRQQREAAHRQFWQAGLEEYAGQLTTRVALWFELVRSLESGDRQRTTQLFMTLNGEEHLRVFVAYLAIARPIARLGNATARYEGVDAECRRLTFALLGGQQGPSRLIDYVRKELQAEAIGLRIAIEEALFPLSPWKRSWRAITETARHWWRKYKEAEAILGVKDVSQ